MAIASLIISIVVAAAVVYREWIHSFFFKPDLSIEFSLDEPISREAFVGWPPATPTPGVWKKAFWSRLRVTNKGKSSARRCEGVLAEVRMPDGKLDKRYDPLTLRWAIAPIGRGLEPLDIARGRQVDLNTFTTFVGETDALFATYPDSRGVPLSLSPGGYWLRIVIFGDNFKPVSTVLAVQWDGKDYKKIRMQVVKELPANFPSWPYDPLSTP